MPQTVETLFRENIFDVYGEHDADKRRAKIASSWAEDGVFIVVSQGRSYKGRAGIDKAAPGLALVNGEPNGL